MALFASALHTQCEDRLYNKAWCKLQALLEDWNCPGSSGKARCLGSGRARSERLYGLIQGILVQPFSAVVLATGHREKWHRSCWLFF